MDELSERFKIQGLDFHDIRKKHQESRAGLKKIFREVSETIQSDPHLPYQIWLTLKDIPIEAIVFLLLEFDKPGQRTFLVTYLTKHKDLNPAVGGGDLKSLGLKPGPQFGSILARVREALIVGDIATDKEAQLQYVKYLINNGKQ